MTETLLQAALGLTSCEGAFRAACEAVLGTARRSQADLLQLLRANLQDPALNWRLREQETHRKVTPLSPFLSVSQHS